MISALFEALKAKPLKWLLIVIIAGFMLAAAISLSVMRTTQARVQLVAQDALIDIARVHQLRQDIAERRMLVSSHILERNPAEKRLIEIELVKAAARMDAAAAEYRRRPDGSELEGWRELERKLAAVRPKTERVIELSRRNRPDQARAAMKATEPDFNSIDRVAESLVSLTRVAADREIEQIRTLNRRATMTLAALALVWGVSATAAARWVAQLLRQRQRDMEQARELLEERNRDLDAFAGQVAHDLRGPLTTISLAAFLLATPKVFEGDSGRILLRAVKRMETTIDDLLTLSRVRGEGAIAQCNAANSAATAEEQLRPAVEAVGGLLRVEVEAALVACNEGFLRQVFWNLGENAVKYRRADVRLEIDIRGRVISRAYEFVVTDNGIGMSPWEARQAFDPFFRGKQAQSRQGTGLGLSIVKRAIEVSGGSVSIESTPGQGTTFRIVLPLVESKAA
ncbi:MAG TPA: ATP-binding protein [Terriglobia bacterium]|nr:ATP-binding protein [Terriglobia bacterium]